MASLMLANTFLAQNEVSVAPAVAGALIVIVFTTLVFVFVAIAAWWKIFTKAGQPGWAVIVPVYNFIVLLQIVGRPIWWVILLLIPLVNIIVLLLVFIDLAKSFGKGAGFGIGLWLLGFVFVPVLGFGSAEYEGPAAG